jgi:uncharacterized damage-inducible protein DinB
MAELYDCLECRGINRLGGSNVAAIEASYQSIAFVHVLMHSIRHYAQLATLMRQHGIKPDWPGDYLFMQATALCFGKARRP